MFELDWDLADRVVLAERVAVPLVGKEDAAHVGVTVKVIPNRS